MSAKLLEMQLSKKQSRKAAAWFDSECAKLGEAGYVIGQVRIRCVLGTLNPCTAKFRVISRKCGEEVNVALEKELKRDAKRAAKGGKK